MTDYNYEIGELVATTKTLVGDCGMFKVEKDTIAKIVGYKPNSNKILIVITPHELGFITPHITSVRKLDSCEQQIARLKFNRIPKHTFEPATLAKPIINQIPTETNNHY